MATQKSTEEQVPVNQNQVSQNPVDSRDDIQHNDTLDQTELCYAERHNGQYYYAECLYAGPISTEFGTVEEPDQGMVLV
jgi:hypothetical protein